MNVFLKSTPTLKSNELNKENVKILVDYLKEIERSLN